MASEHRLRDSLLLAAILFVFWLAGSLGLARATGIAGDRFAYNLPGWITGHLARIWLNPVARTLGGGYARATDGQVVDFLSEASSLAASERDLAYAQATGRGEQGAEQVVRQRSLALEPLGLSVESRLSDQLTESISAQGLSSSLPLLKHAPFVWPPVAFGYDLPPYVLIRSPRDRIELLDAQLLSSNLTQAEADRLVASAEKRGESALVVRIGGLASYPSIVEKDDSYADAIELLAHEWIHQYLFFHPLGVRYFESRQLMTINETVANMAGRELAADLRSRFPLAGTPVRARSNAPPADPSINFDRTLHQLRVDVDELLAQGRVAEAEQRMDETHTLLVDHGYYIPRLNQAYFAFYGSYADTPASTNPVGPRLANLRKRFPTLQAFIHVVENVRSPGDFSRLLQASAE
jgi:hypothetical protein